MSDERLDILAIGAHPDDVEAACGGSLAKWAARGRRVGICDLTRGELATNGTVSERAIEAEAAAKVLGVARRIQLALPDGRLDARDATQLEALVGVVRRFAPRLLIGPHPRSRHPDHVEAATLVERARFFAAVERYPPAIPAVVRPRLLLAPDYWPVEPSFVVEIEATLALKIAALRCYRSQFERSGDKTPTHLNNPAYLRRIELDAAHYGRLCGVAAGEAFVVEGAVRLDDPLQDDDSRGSDNA